MLKGIPACLSPGLLKVLDEMGHGDTLVLGDANFPAASCAKGHDLIRADGVRAVELLDAVLRFFPLDSAVEHPVLIMDKQTCDRALETPIWGEFKKIVAKHEKRGAACCGMIDRFAFYEKAKQAYAVVATTEVSLYACLILQKGCL